jgi:hypothetical protein
MEDNGGAPPALDKTSTSAVHLENIFICPSLSTLNIDGRNYYNACQRAMDFWKEMLPAVYNLSISHFTPVATRGESFTTSRLLHSLGLHELFTVHLDDLHLEESPNHIFYGSDLKHLVLENMPSPRCTQEIVDGLGPHDHLHIIRSGLISRNIRRAHLTLQEINEGEDLVAFISDFRGRSLVVKNCPSFNDQVLSIMAIPKHYCALDLETLSIHNCPNISVPALKKMVETRCDDTQYRLRAMRIYGRIPEILLEDAKWFRDRLVVFEYYQE